MRATWLALIGICACAPEPTQLVVVVDTDLPIPGQVARIDATVQGAVYDVPWTNTFAVSLQSDVPFSFGVIGADNPSLPVTIDVAAIDSNGTTILTRRAISSLVDEKIAVLPMFLHQSCTTVPPCNQPGQTCDDGTCRSDTIDVNTLATIETPGSEL